jgi:hypothetical protein
MLSLPAKWKDTKMTAIELLIKEPELSYDDVGAKSGVTGQTIYRWMRDPEFVDVYYQKYMITFGSRLPSVLTAMVREAESGNVQAGRLVLEHSGKLIKRVEVASHQSPFEKFLKADVSDIKEIEAEDAEFEEVVAPVMESVVHKTAAQEQRELTKKQHQLQVRRDARSLRDRATKVGLKIGKQGRQSLRKRRAWIKKIEELEAQS